MNTSPLLARIAARRSQSAQPESVMPPPARQDPQSEPTAAAPFVPEWRRRAAARVEQDGFVAVVDTTSLA